MSVTFDQFIASLLKKIYIIISLKQGCQTQFLEGRSPAEFYPASKLCRAPALQELGVQEFDTPALSPKHTARLSAVPDERLAS